MLIRQWRRSRSIGAAELNFTTVPPQILRSRGKITFQHCACPQYVLYQRRQRRMTGPMFGRPHVVPALFAGLVLSLALPRAAHAQAEPDGAASAFDGAMSPSDASSAVHPYDAGDGLTPSSFCPLGPKGQTTTVVRAGRHRVPTRPPMASPSSSSWRPWHGCAAGVGAVADPSTRASGGGARCSTSRLVVGSPISKEIGGCRSESS